jgi:tetratricopeptide (TPR) repeat protein
LDGAVRDDKKALELNPDVWQGPIQLSQVYVMQGRRQNALAEIELVHLDPARRFLYAVAYYALGRQKEADAALSELIAKHHADAAYQIAQVYAFRKQSNEAFKWLDQAYAQRDGGLIGTNVDPFLKNLHNDPRFASFLKTIHLPN